jgi:hypothetical protein
LNVDGMWVLVHLQLPLWKHNQYITTSRMESCESKKQWQPWTMDRGHRTIQVFQRSISFSGEIIRF